MWDDARNYYKDKIIEYKDKIKNFIQDPETQELLKADNFQKIFDAWDYWKKFEIDTLALYQFFRYTSGIDVSNYLTRIPDSAYYAVEFSDSNLIIPNNITEIGVCAFCVCTSFKSVTIPDGVTTIRYRAFSDCTALTSMTIPDSVTRIEEGAFYGCDSLKDVYYKGTKEQWEKIYIKEFNYRLLNIANIHFS